MTCKGSRLCYGVISASGFVVSDVYKQVLQGCNVEE